MKVLTKEFKDEKEFDTLYFAFKPCTKEIIPVFFLNDAQNGVAKSDIKTIKTKFNVSRKENELNYIFLPDSFYCFSEKVEGFDFLSQYVDRLRVISKLPKEILKLVKDKRLLALGYAEQSVRQMILDYTGEKFKVTSKKFVDCLEDSIYATGGLSIERQFALHPHIYSVEPLFEEAIIERVVKKGKDIYFKLNNGETFVLTDAETLEEEINPDDTFVKFFELHRFKRYHELHFLLRTTDDDFNEDYYYATYRFKDMRLI